MKKLLVFSLCFVTIGVFAQSPSSNSTAASSHPGILLMAHGGRVQTWNEEVRHVADQADLKIPTEIAFGMATRSTLQSGIDRLVARGVTEIIAVPLFVSSHSSVIDSTAYLLGVRNAAPEDLKVFASMDHGGMAMDHGSMDHSKPNEDAMKPVHSPVPIRIASALDHHAIVADILLDRATTISTNPANEVVMLIAHGPVPDSENLLWLNEMKLLADAMQAKTKYAQIICLTVRDDADDSVRDKATQELRGHVEEIRKSGKTALVVPLLLSYGGIENGLRDRLKGLTYKMPTQGLLPDPRISTWVLSSEERVVAGDLQPTKDSVH